jgi:ADP-ribosyl-[dinitrogen reductase] hydrolase
MASNRNKTDQEISGSGYVASSLEAALWCFCTTSALEQAILRAANLGDDADTTAAVCGQLAGAFYGIESIPAQWRSRLAMHDFIQDLADHLCRSPMPE